MNGAVSEDTADRTTYHCVVGHEISSLKLEKLTEMASLDAGALVRLCREHGTPIEIRVESPTAPAAGAEVED